MTRAAALWTLLVLFVGRVAGQLAVALDAAPFLPPMEEGSPVCCRIPSCWCRRLR